MSALKLVLWGFLAILGAVALAFVVGFVNPQEKVNGLWLVVAAACIYVLAFRFYGRWISQRVVEPPYTLPNLRQFQRRSLDPIRARPLKSGPFLQRGSPHNRVLNLCEKSAQWIEFYRINGMYRIISSPRWQRKNGETFAKSSH
jgi:Carbon starvation protein CstA